MCGICGVVDLGGGPTTVREIAPMNDALRLRGPDDEGPEFQAEQPVDPATSTRLIKLMPSRTAPSLHPAVTLGGGPAQMADLIDLKLSANERSFITRADLPPDQVFMLRITAGLHSVLAALEATINWDDLGRELGLW